MEPRLFLQALMDRAGDNAHSLAAHLHKPSMQGQLWRFLEGQTREPRRATLEPVAKYYRVSVEAFFDKRQARAEAVRLHLDVKGALATEPAPSPYRDEATIESTVRRLGDLLSRHTPARQKTLADVLSRFACEPSSDELANELMLQLAAPPAVAGKREAA